MTAAAFVFFYLIAAILVMQKPILLVWGLCLYVLLVARSFFASW